MTIISLASILKYRARTFHYDTHLLLKSPSHAVDFVNERGFILFWPNKSQPFPSLWGAVAGDRPVPDNHDDPGHISWEWKDSLLDKRVWYYARILKKRNSIVSLDSIPYFYALSPNYGEPEIDLLDQYNHGEITLESKLIFEALLRKGPLDTISLRKEAHLVGAASTSPFNTAMNTLQQQLRVLPVAVSQAGAWKYAFVYDLTHRYFPELLEKARSITETQAVDHLIIRYLQSMGISTTSEAASFIGLSTNIVQKSMDRLAALGKVLGDIQIENNTRLHYCVPDLFK